MKTKNLNKKLVLSKATVSNLDNVVMREVYGGTVQTDISLCVFITVCRKCPEYIPYSDDESC